MTTPFRIIAPSSGLVTYRTFPEGKPLANDAVTAMEMLGEEWREVLAERNRERERIDQSKSPRGE